VTIRDSALRLYIHKLYILTFTNVRPAPHDSTIWNPWCYSWVTHAHFTACTINKHIDSIPTAAGAVGTSFKITHLAQKEIVIVPGEPFQTPCSKRVVVVAGTTPHDLVDTDKIYTYMATEW
jgi:hypothetical protein